MRFWTFVSALLLLLGALARGDTLVLKNGGKFEGKLVEKTRTHYVFDIAGLGVQRFTLDQVRRVDKGETIQDEFERRRKDLDPKSADAQFRLGLWCEEKKLGRQAKRMFARALELDPDHAPTREKLGFVKHEGTWRTAEEAAKAEADAAMPIEERLVAILEAHRLGKTRRLASERIWYWPPEG